MIILLNSLNKLRYGVLINKIQHRSYGKQIKNITPSILHNFVNKSNITNSQASNENKFFSKQDFASIIQNFNKNESIKKITLSLGIKHTNYDFHINQFCTKLINNQIYALDYSKATNIFLESGKFSLEQRLLKSFLKYIEPSLDKQEKEKYFFIKDLAKLDDPINWFPQARKLKRKIIMHVGPTNSGKTYHALQKLKNSSRGVYCGPLRLLAYEVWKRFMDEGIRCDLITGEERILAEDYVKDPLKYKLSNNNELPSVPNFNNPERLGNLLQRITSATIEMLSLNQLYEVAVFDEIQLIGDKQRGWGWLRAVIGVQAHEIHLCGEESAVPFIKKLCEQMNEKIEINEYNRLSPLNIDQNSLKGKYNQIQKGDCLVTFSRNNIFLHQNNIQRETGLKCAVVYGRLPPENRAIQAKLFNDPNSGYDVMVASDAVGMGLNLNIQRVIFDSLEKFNGKKMKRIAIPQVKQIAGRAGRFNTKFSNGIATTLFEQDIPYLLHCINHKSDPLKRFGLQPDIFQLKKFTYQFPKDSLAEILIKYIALCDLPSEYFLCFTEDHLKIAMALSDIPLSLEERMIFLVSPIPVRDKKVMEFAIKAIEAHSRGNIIQIKHFLKIPNEKTGSDKLEALEILHRCIMLYLWLSFRFTFTFSDVESAKELKVKVENLLNNQLIYKKKV